MDIITLALILALIGVILLIAYTRKSTSNEDRKEETKSTIPGLGPSLSKNGQLLFGEFSLFLKDLHQRFGPVVSFYQYNRYTVSVSDPELMKTCRYLENTPTDIFEQFETVMVKESFGFQELEERRRRRKLYDHHFMLKACKSHAECFLQIAEEYVERLRKMSKDDHLPLWEMTSDATLKAILQSNYGDYFKDEQSFKEFKKLFANMNKLLEIETKPNSPEQMELKKTGDEINAIIKTILISREQNTSDTERNLFIDVLLDDTSISKEAQIADSMMFINAGYEVTGKMIMWALYELCAQPELQEKVYQELKTVLGDGKVTLETLPKLKYLSQVLDETMRFRFNTIFNLRVVKEELKIGNYVIPADSRLYINTGLSFKDEKYYANPEKFDPDHFAPENTKSRHAYAFKPFGFAGKRQCPGQTYARSKMSIFLAEWIRQFKFTLVPDQDLKLVLGFVIRPENDVWVTVESRN